MNGFLDVTSRARLAPRLASSCLILDDLKWQEFFIEPLYAVTKNIVDQYSIIE